MVHNYPKYSIHQAIVAYFLALRLSSGKASVLCATLFLDLSHRGIGIMERTDSVLNPPLRLLAAFQREFAKEQPKHVYKIDGRDMWVAAELIAGDSFTIVVPDRQWRIRFDRSSAKRRRSHSNRPLPQWAKHLAGSLGSLERAGLSIQGAHVVLSGDEPAGPRFEYALGMAFLALWHEVNGKLYTTQVLLDMMDEIQHDYIEA
jgi:hypothetical protein